MRAISPSSSSHSSQKGSAIVIILVLIALIAGLTAVFSRSSSRSVNNMDKEQARLAAEKLMRQAKTWENAVQFLMNANRCSEKQLSFSNIGTTYVYTNAAAPSDKSCDVFDSGGAGQAYANPDTTILDSSKSALTVYGQWMFRATQCVYNVGTNDGTSCTTSNVPLIAEAPHIKLDVCLAINDLLGITNPSGAPPVEDIDNSATNFTGSYTVGASAQIGATATATGLRSHAQGCVQDNSGTWSGSYIYYHAMLVR